MILRYPSIISWQACCSFLLSIISIYYPISMKCVILSQANYFCLLNTYIWFSKGSDCVCQWIMNWRWRFLVHNTIQYLSLYLWFLKFGTAKFHAPHFIVKYICFYLILLFCLCILRIVIVIMLSIYILENEYITERKQYYYLGKEVFQSTIINWKYSLDKTKMV